MKSNNLVEKELRTLRGGPNSRLSLPGARARETGGTLRLLAVLRPPDVDNLTSNSEYGSKGFYRHTAEGIHRNIGLRLSYWTEFSD
jgi:hypothetical protein